MSDNKIIKLSEDKSCHDCRYFLGCECFSGKTCDDYEETVIPSDDTEIGMLVNPNDRM